MLLLLQTLSLKDLEDAKDEVLLDHIKIAKEFEKLKMCEKDIFIKYVMNPRVDYE